MNDDPIQMPIDGELDLHLFDPKEIKDIVPEYISACLEKNIFQIRIIHGKGKGVLRRIVQSILDNHPAVKSFKHESGSGGSWGATIVDIQRVD